MPVCVVMGIAALHPSYKNTLSRSRDADRPRFAINFPALFVRGRREDRVHAAPAVSRAICANKSAHDVDCFASLAMTKDMSVI